MTAILLVLRSLAACNAGAAVSLYQSECDVWCVVAAALTGLPVYPSLTCSLHPFCLFLQCLSTWTSNLPCEGLGDHRVHKFAHSCHNSLISFSGHYLLTALNSAVLHPPSQCPSFQYIFLSWHCALNLAHQFFSMLLNMSSHKAKHVGLCSDSLVNVCATM